ncbi:hypothetical protein ITJ43_12545 [Microbacterium sp. VKM Ac-2870]|uniref:hypothetical protein n=1 Tax=Microbacterium sp. VKM Ac-2870 TaxID=2783825 RepID=UPI00188C1213|nr:hypothetical protein [Microbacterium sp. VKM Ac-2870]MBF4562961.1 hypothetical protein [Microbacterium sp. VKM Ac-2870]
MAEIAENSSLGTALRTNQERLTASAPALAWRLVSENRREIARGCRVFGDEASAKSDLKALLRMTDAFEIHTSPAPRLRSTGWFVSAGDQLLMMGARRYEKRSAAESAAELAVRLMRDLSAGPVPVLREPHDPLILL